MAYSEKANLQN